MIMVVSFKSTSKFDVVLTKSEVLEIISCIKWTKYDDEWDTHHDMLSKKELNLIIQNNPKHDFIKKPYDIEIDMGFDYGFSLQEYYNNKILLPKPNVASLDLGSQITPFENCPTFVFGNEKRVWRKEIGFFEIFDSNNVSKGFYNYLSKHLAFTNINQFEKHKKEIILLKSNYNMLPNNNDKYVRVISVYDKITKKLKYRILNNEFNYNSFAYINLNSLDNDFFYLQSYQITKKNAIEYNKWSILNIDYDFEINDYYFETLNANTFLYSYDDMFKKLDK